MPQLDQVTTSDIWCPEEGTVEPGKWVKHVQDDKSYGLVVGRVGVDVSVLWSKSPKGLVQVQVSSINAPARKLSARWSAEIADDLYGMYGIDGESRVLPREPMYEVVEEYSSMDYSEIEQLHKEGAHIQLHHNNGGVTVTRKTYEPPPDDAYRNGNVRSRRVTYNR